MLIGKVIPVKLGIIGVINRSQEDIKNNKSIESAKEYESSFLMAKYPDLEACNGSTYLVKRLNEILVEHAQKCLPEVRKDLIELDKEYCKKQKAYGEILEENQRVSVFETCCYQKSSNRNRSILFRARNYLR